MRRRHSLLGLALLSVVAAAACSGPCTTEEYSSTAKGTVTRCVNAADSALAAAVRDRLAAEAILEGTEIHVSAAGRTVTLKGWVHDERARIRAEKVCYALDGVDHVENELSVMQAPENPRGM